MGKLNDIKEKLLAGSTTRQLVEQGYAKSSVFGVARKLNNLQPAVPASPITDELQELRHQKELIKLQKDIAELLAAKEKLPERMATLEKSVDDLRSLVNNAVDTALWVCMQNAGMNREEAREYANGWVERNIKG
jgi:hypothetical protein